MQMQTMHDMLRWSQQSKSSGQGKNSEERRVKSGKFQNSDQNANFNFVINTLLWWCAKEITVKYSWFSCRPVPLSSTFQNLNSSISNFDFLNAFCGQTWIPGKHHNRDSFWQQRWKVLVLLRYISLLSGLWNIFDRPRNTNMNINKDHQVGQLTKFDCTTNRTKIIYGPFYSSLNFRVFIWFFAKELV